MAWDLSKLRSLATRVEGASVAGVAEAQQIILARADELVPVREGTLAGTGSAPPPTAEGDKVVGVVSFGSSATQTPWEGGTGYELFQEFGTRGHAETPVAGRALVLGAGGDIVRRRVFHPGIAGVHFLEIATFESTQEILTAEADAFRVALRGG